jgi:hypothetical protein
MEIHPATGLDAHIGGLGVESPLPKRLVRAYPKLAVYLFILGGPVLFLALLVT